MKSSVVAARTLINVAKLWNILHTSEIDNSSFYLLKKAIVRACIYTSIFVCEY